jgi:Na+/phosphate symporter
MFRKLLARIEKNRTQRFIVNIRAWYKTCYLLTKTYGDALYDQCACESDIGVMLDKADRMLFQLSSYTADALSLLRRKEPALAKKVDVISTQVYRLRNQTTSFLIRCQGNEDSLVESRQASKIGLAYYQALEEVGFTTRRLQRELEKELALIWAELQSPILTAEQSLAT